MKTKLLMACAVLLGSCGGLLAAGDEEVLLTTQPAIPLRITFQPQGCLSIDAGEGKLLSQCRAYLASRLSGSREWKEETADYKLVSRDGKKIVLEASFSAARATVTLEGDETGRYELAGKIEATSARAIDLARFHYLDGFMEDPGMNLLSMRHYELPGRIVKPSETRPAPCKSTWGWSRLAEPIHNRPNTAISGDSGMLASDWNSPGFFFGFTTPGSAFGEIGIRTAQQKPSFFLAVLLDGIRLESGKQRVLESAVVSCGDPQDELRRWIALCRDRLGPARVQPPLVGYCSWYQKGQSVHPSDIRRAMEVYSSYDAPPGGRTIQIDDGYQVCPGKWNGRDEWSHELNKLPAEMAAKGYIPGIWIAPTAISSSHPIVKEHPEWLQRNAKGEFCIRFHNWKRFEGMTNAETYFLESDHPEARKFILDTLRPFRAAGWKYFKIDFAYTVSSDRVKYDPHKTTYETLRDQWKLFREALGEDALINSCNGGIWRYTIGAMDISRIGGDTGSNMKSLRRNLAEMMLRSHANGVWFQVDPDVFYMRRERSSLNFEQSHLLTATQGLLGTAFLTSDFADQWSDPAAQVVRRYWNKQGPRVPKMLYILLSPDGLPTALSVAYGKGEYAVGLYNWNKEPRDVSVRLADLRLPSGWEFKAAPASAGGEPVTLADGALTVARQPAESMRVITLSRTKSGNE